MIIFPAIDLKDGKCVRLYKGLMDEATIFNDSPKNQAKKFEDDGFEWIHIVDLNGAFSGKPENSNAVKEIIAATNLKLQLGGGIRNLETIKMWLDLGINRVILGTVALKNPQIVIDACKLYPNQIVVGIDGKDGKVAVEGWAETSEISVIDLAKKIEDAGVSAIIYTDIGRDGAMLGADMQGTKTLAEAVNVPVIASGGISSNQDIEAIRDLQKYGVSGLISGRAIYDGKIDIKQALENKTN